MILKMHMHVFHVDYNVLDIYYVQIILQGVLEEGRRGEIALDSIYIENGSCAHSGWPQNVLSQNL